VHLFHFNRHPVDLENVSANRHLSFVFLVKIIFWEAAIKDERFVRKGRRLGEFKARVAHIHGGPQIQGGAANLRFS